MKLVLTHREAFNSLRSTLPPLWLMFADGCAWRAVYLYRRGASYDRLVLSLGIDPRGGSGRPEMFGCWFGRQWRFTLPWPTWNFCVATNTVFFYTITETWRHELLTNPSFYRRASR